MHYRFLRAQWGEIVVVIVMLAAVFLLFTPLLTHMLWGRGFDYPLHLKYVQDFREGRGGMIPYPAFHISVLMLTNILPPKPFMQTYKEAGLIVGILVYQLTALVLYWVYIRPTFTQHKGNELTAALSAVTTLLLMLVAPVNLFSVREGHLYWGYFLSNIHMNPTFVIMKPFALLLFVYVVGAFSSKPHFKSWWAVVIAVTLTTLTTFAKPNFTICILPALALSGIYRLYRHELVNWRLLILGLVIPASLILIVQVFGFTTPMLDGGAIEFRPFMMLQQRGIHRLPFKFLFSILFPLAVYLLFTKHAVKTAELNLAWLIFGIGAFYSYGFIEANRVGDGNFMWSGQIAVAVLFAASTTFFLRQKHFNTRGFRFASLICIAVLGLHCLSGVFWYYADMVSPGFVWY